MTPERLSLARAIMRRLFRSSDRLQRRIQNLVRHSQYGNRHISRRTYDESVTALSRALEQNPQDTLSRAYLGMSLFNLNRFAESATAFIPLGNAAVSNPAFAPTYALSLVRSYQPEAASSLLSALISAAPTAAIQVAVAGVYVELEDFDRATSSAKSALQADPNIPGAHAAAGRALLGLHRPAEAVSEFHAELLVTPETGRSRLDTKVLRPSKLMMSGQALRRRRWSKTSTPLTRHSISAAKAGRRFAQGRSSRGIRRKSSRCNAPQSGYTRAAQRAFCGTLAREINRKSEFSKEILSARRIALSMSSRTPSCEAGWARSFEAVVSDIYVTQHRQQERVMHSNTICNRALGERDDRST